MDSLTANKIFVGDLSVRAARAGRFYFYPHLTSDLICPMYTREVKRGGNFVSQACCAPTRFFLSHVQYISLENDRNGIDAPFLFPFLSISPREFSCESVHECNLIDATRNIAAILDAHVYIVYVDLFL